MTAWRREASERTGPFVSPRLSVAVDGLKGRARAQKQRGDSALLRSQDAGEAPITLQTQTHNTCNLTRRMHIACFQKVRYRIVARINRASEGPSSSLLSTLAQPALTSDMGCVECCQPAMPPYLYLCEPIHARTRRAGQPRVNHRTEKKKVLVSATSQASAQKITNRARAWRRSGRRRPGRVFAWAVAQEMKLKMQAGQAGQSAWPMHAITHHHSPFPVSGWTRNDRTLFLVCADIRANRTS